MLLEREGKQGSALMWERNIHWLPFVRPDLDWAHKACALTEIQPATFWFAGGCPTSWASPAKSRKSNSYSSFNIIILTLETEWVFKVTSNSLVPGEYRHGSEWCNVLKAVSTLLKVLFFEKQRTNFLNSVCITHTLKKNYFYTSFTFFLFILFIHFFLYKENLAALLLFYRTQYANKILQCAVFKYQIWKLN